jgi:hypothetical protein
VRGADVTLSCSLSRVFFYNERQSVLECFPGGVEIFDVGFRSQERIARANMMGDPSFNPHGRVLQRQELEGVAVRDLEA